MSKSKLKIDSRLIDVFVDTWNEMVEGADLEHRYINHGWCYQLALVIKRIYGGKLYGPSSGHTWVRIGGVDYDSDNLNGTTSLTDRYGSWYGKLKTWNEKDFKAVWNPIGNSGPVRMDVVKETVKRYKKELKQNNSKMAA